MIEAALALFFAAAMANARVLPLIPAYGVHVPERVEIEWLGPESSSLAIETIPVTNGAIAVGAPPREAESVRVVGPDVVSLPVPIKSNAHIRLLAAGKLRLSAVPQQTALTRVFLKLNRSDLEYSRELRTSGLTEIEFTVPPGTYSAAVDIGPEYPPIVVPSLVIDSGSVGSLKTKNSTGRPLILQVVTKEDKKPLTGASVAQNPTAELPSVFWRALAARCGISDQSGILSCGVVPLTLHKIEVVAPQRRRAIVSVPVPDPDSDARQPLQLTLARYQNVAVSILLRNDTPQESVKELTAVLVRCQWPPCDESKAVRLGLGSRRTVRFSQVEPGVYRTWLEGRLVRSSATPVIVSADSDAPDTLDVPLDLELWRITGSTRVEGIGVPATIWFATLREKEHQQEWAGVVNTSSTGTYDKLLLAPVDAYIFAHATSENPPAEGETAAPGVRLSQANYQIVVDIDLSTAGASIKLIDSQTKSPIPNCEVALYHWGEAQGGIRVFKSNESGIVRWLGIKGTFLARATCDGYRTASTEKIEISSSPNEKTLELEPAGEARLRVRDANDHPLPGARVFVEQSRFENVSFPFYVSAEQIGSTDFSGEIAVPARPRPGFYVVAQGYALHVGRLAPCAVRTGCVEDVRLARPIPFPGIRVRSARGAAQSAAWLVFSKDGVPIPVSIQKEVVTDNQADARVVIIQEGSDTIHMLPEFFEPGVYEIEYAKAEPGKVPQRISLGRMSLPTTQRLELTLPDEASH